MNIFEIDRREELFEEVIDEKRSFEIVDRSAKAKEDFEGDPPIEEKRTGMKVYAEIIFRATSKPGDDLVVLGFALREPEDA